MGILCFAEPFPVRKRRRDASENPLRRDKSYSILAHVLHVALTSVHAHEEAPVGDKGPGTLWVSRFRFFGYRLI